MLSSRTFYVFASIIATGFCWLLLVMGQTAWAARFAVIGDYGYYSDPLPQTEIGAWPDDVADLVNSLNPDFIVTVGDNNQGGARVSNSSKRGFRMSVGRFYGPEAQGSGRQDYISTRRFFPAVGNHDVDPLNSASPNRFEFDIFLDYFNGVARGTGPGNLMSNPRDPGDGEIYDFTSDDGTVHIFVLNSMRGMMRNVEGVMRERIVCLGEGILGDTYLPEVRGRRPCNPQEWRPNLADVLDFDPNTPCRRQSLNALAEQACWLRKGLASSNASWKIVVFHQAAYHVGSSKVSEALRWPFEEWGADAILNGHVHSYNVILRDDNGDGKEMPYFVVGAGGWDLRDMIAGCTSSTTSDAIDASIPAGCPDQNDPLYKNIKRFNRNNDNDRDFGTLLVEATKDCMDFEYHSIEPSSNPPNQPIHYGFMICKGSPPPVDQADIMVSKSDDPDPVLVGQNLTYTLVVQNNGPDAATGVTLTDELPATVDFVSATSEQGRCSKSGGEVKCTLGRVASGTNRNVTIMIEVIPTSTGVITNSVSVSANVDDQDLSNNDSIETTSVQASIPPVSDSPVISGVSPDVLAPQSMAQLTLSGENFQSGASVIICRRGGLTVTNVAVTDSNTILVDVDVGTPQESRCGIRVDNPDGEWAIARKLITISEDPPQLLRRKMVR